MTLPQASLPRKLSTTTLLYHIYFGLPSENRATWGHDPNLKTREADFFYPKNYLLPTYSPLGRRSPAVLHGRLIFYKRVRASCATGRGKTPRVHTSPLSTKRKVFSTVFAIQHQTIDIYGLTGNVDISHSYIESSLFGTPYIESSLFGILTDFGFFHATCFSRYSPTKHSSQLISSRFSKGTVLPIVTVRPHTANTCLQLNPIIAAKCFVFISLSYEAFQ